MLKKIRKSLDYYVRYGYNKKSTLYIARFLHLCQRFAKRAKSMAELSLLKLNNMYTSCSSNVALPLRNRYRKSDIGNSLLQPISNSDAVKYRRGNILNLQGDVFFVDQDWSVKTLCGGDC